MSTPAQALFVSYTSLLGGAELILLDQMAALRGPVVLVCPEGPLADRARAAGAQVAILATRSTELRASMHDRIAMPLRIAAQARELRRIVGRLRPRCVIAWGMRALLACALSLLGLRPRPPLVFQHNDLLPSPLVGGAVRVAGRRANLIVALSAAIAADLRSHGRLPARVAVIRAGVDLGRFRPVASGADQDTAGGAPTVLVLGAIVGWKRPDLALEAAALATREIPELRLRLAGAPIGAAGARLRADLERRAARPDLAGRVDFAGGIEDVPAALAAATCLLHCSDREPYGMALVEALACGRPVVAPAAAGPLEIVDASCGALYPPGDVAAAAAALVRVVREAAALGAGARARAEAHFDHRIARERFRALIEEIAA